MVDIEKLREWIVNQSATFSDHIESNEYASGSYDAYECALRFLDALELENEEVCPNCGGESQPASYHKDWCPKCRTEWEINK